MRHWTWCDIDLRVPLLTEAVSGRYHIICNYNCRQRRSRLTAAKCGISSGSTLFAKTKMIFGEKLQFCLEIKTCDPLNYIMDHSKFIASIQKEELISSFNSSANYYIQQQNLNYMYMMKHQILWISCCCHSLNCICSKSCKFHAESTPVMESFYEVYYK